MTNSTIPESFYGILCMGPQISEEILTTPNTFTCYPDLGASFRPPNERAENFNDWKKSCGCWPKRILPEI